MVLQEQKGRYMGEVRVKVKLTNGQMSQFFSRNIDRKGRITRAIYGALCIIGGLLLAKYSWLASGVLIASGAFAFFEAIRGWCLMRACGIKTKY